jgi:bifunctional non-homologous end joining protein LigD
VARSVHWVEPKLAAEIAYSERTADGRLRHPIFHGLREDKPAKEIVEERPLSPEEVAPKPTEKSAKDRVKLSNPDKVLFPDPGITKRQLAAYWEEVAEVALPLLEHRPLTLYRCPEGYAQHCFYQKHVGAGVPAVIPRVTIKDDEDPYAMIEDVSSFVGLAQVGVLELHVWGSRAEHLEQPDIIVFDLDPAEDVPWSEVVTAGFEVKARLERLGLNAFAKLTGGKGLHVVVPVVPGPEWRAVKRFARAVVNEMVREEPRRFIASMSKAKRTGKIFIDYLRNDREATAIGSYSPRARAGAPVALPVEWDDLSPDARSAPRFGLLEVPKLIRRRKRDPWESFESARRSLVA